MRIRALLTALLTLLVALAVTAHAAESERKSVSLVKGRSQLVKLPFAPGAGANSNPGVVQGTVEGKSILLMAREHGEATYTIWSRDKKRSLEIDIVVSDRDMKRVHRELEEALSDFEQVTVRMSDGNVIVEGEVATEAELDRVNRIVSRYEGPGFRSDISGP